MFRVNMEEGKGRDIGRLSKALSTFAATARYGMLKTLQVGRFVENGPTEIGVLSEYTFEKLIELGSRKISKLRWLTPSQEERLLTLLAALSEGEEVMVVPPPPRSKSEMVNDPGEEEEIGSVKLELDLRETLKSLRAHDDYARVKDKSLAYFWDPVWPRAPFEEAFTIEQLAQMDLSMLFKKRSTSNRRVRNMILALGRALDLLRAHVREVPAPTPRVHEEMPRPREEAPVRPLSSQKDTTRSPHRWLRELDELSLTNRNRLSLLGTAGVGYLLVSCEALKDSLEPCERALSTFPDLFTIQELTEILELGELRPELQQRLQTWLASHKGLERTCAALKEALRGPGAHTVNLLRSIPSLYNLPNSIQVIVCHILIRTLGAHRVSIGKQVMRDIWTLNPNLLPLILKEVKRRKTLRPIDVLSMICPEMDQFLLNNIIESQRNSTAGTLSRRKHEVPPQQRGKKRAAHGPVKA